MKPFGALVQPNSKVDLYSQHSFKVDTQGLGHQFTLWLNVMGSNDGQLKLAISWKVLPMLLSVQKNKKKNPTWLGCLFPKWQFNLTGWSHLKAGFGGRYADSRQSVSLITSGRPEGAQCFRTQFCFNDLDGKKQRCQRVKRDEPNAGLYPYSHKMYCIRSTAWFLFSYSSLNIVVCEVKHLPQENNRS